MNYLVGKEKCKIEEVILIENMLLKQSNAGRRCMGSSCMHHIELHHFLGLHNSKP